MTELTDPELAEALQAGRPVPTTHFARRMDRWADEGFQRGAAIPRPKPQRLRKPLLGLAGALAAMALGVTALGVVAGNGTDDEGSESVSGASTAASAPPSPPPSPIVERSGGNDQALRATPADAAGFRSRGRRVERSAALALGAPPADLEEVAAGVARVTDAARGYVARSTIDAQAGGGGAEFELRIPAARLTVTLARLSELADVRSRSQSTQDITRITASAAERLQEARAERRGLLRRIARDGGDDATRARLRSANRRIARAKGDLASARRRADLARVSVTVTGDPRSDGAGGDGRWTPGDALKDAARVLEVVAGVALVAAAVVLPFALLGTPLLLAGRRRRRSGRERALDAA